VFSVPPPPRSTPFPYTTLFRSVQVLALTEPVDDVALRPLFEAAPVGERAGQRGDPGPRLLLAGDRVGEDVAPVLVASDVAVGLRSEEHTSELQSRENLVCRLLL